MDEFENLNQIEEGGARNSGLVISNVYSVRIGGFGVDPRLKTYITTLSVDELNQDVTFYDQLSKDKDWPVSQIVQREVDQDRVNVIATKYLLGQGRQIKYFPPIIVALLPRDSAGNFSKTYTFESDNSVLSKELIFDKSKYRGNEKFKELLISQENRSSVDGLHLYTTSKIFEHNLFCWDKTKFYAVVIDGQHRLEALIKARTENPEYSKAIQDVVFLDASSVIQNVALSPVEVLRTVFIDINTNAKSVGIVRRILMDDKDLASLCVQSLVESVNKDGGSKDLEYFLDPALIDWDGSSLKHELPHITGVLTLYQILSDELITASLVSIDDHRNSRKIKNFIELLNNYFFVDQKIKSIAEFSGVTTLEVSFNEFLRYQSIDRNTFTDSIQEDSLDSILFNFDYRVLEIAQHTFESTYLKSIVSLFKWFLPFENAIKLLDQNNAFNQGTTLNRALILSRTKLTSNHKSVFYETRKRLNDELNPKYYLFYTVVGQKAVFNIFFDRVFKNFEYGIGEEGIVNICDQLLLDLNKCVSSIDSTNIYLFGKEETLVDTYEVGLDSEYGTIASSFWEGILYEDNRIIYNSQGVRALADVINFIIKIHLEKLDKESEEFRNYTFRYAIQRTKRLLKKRFGERTEDEYNSIANKILIEKKNFLYYLAQKFPVATT